MCMVSGRVLIFTKLAESLLSCLPFMLSNIIRSRCECVLNRKVARKAERKQQQQEQQKVEEEVEVEKPKQLERNRQQPQQPQAVATEQLEQQQASIVSQSTKALGLSLNLFCKFSACRAGFQRH